MAKFIDSHTHLCDDSFDEDLDSVISRAQKAGVQTSLVVAQHSGECQKILDIAERFPGQCLPCFGVHPVQGVPTEERRSATEKDLAEMIPWIEKHHERLVAIGEVGLDFTPRWCKTDEDKQGQRNVLTKQVEIAKKYDLPLNVHSRSAGRPTIALLKELGAEKVLMHAFDGRPAVALEGVRSGFFFSIPPSIVRSEQVKLVKQLPLENILLETDSPALGPLKESRNEPCNIHIACEHIAKLKEMDVNVVARTIWENTLKLFPRIQLYLPK